MTQASHAIYSQVVANDPSLKLVQSSSSPYRLDVIYDDTGMWAFRFKRALAQIVAANRVSSTDVLDDRAISCAYGFITHLSEMAVRPSRIAASASGSVVISFIRQGIRANVEFFNTGEIIGAIAESLTAPVLWEIQNDKQEYESAIKRIGAAIAAGSTVADVPGETPAGP